MPEENIPRNASNTTMGEMTPSDSVDSFWESLLGPSPETPPVFDEFGERIDPEVIIAGMLEPAPYATTEQGTTEHLLGQEHVLVEDNAVYAPIDTDNVSDNVLDETLPTSPPTNESTRLRDFRAGQIDAFFHRLNLENGARAIDDGDDGVIMFTTAPARRRAAGRTVLRPDPVTVPAQPAQAAPKETESDQESNQGDNNDGTAPADPVQGPSNSASAAQGDANPTSVPDESAQPVAGQAIASVAAVPAGLAPSAIPLSFASQGSFSRGTDNDQSPLVPSQNEDEGRSFGAHNRNNNYTNLARWFAVRNMELDTSEIEEFERHADEFRSSVSWWSSRSSDGDASDVDA